MGLGSVIGKVLLSESVDDAGEQKVPEGIRASEVRLLGVVLFCRGMP
jgi:hypothetical protein